MAASLDNIKFVTLGVLLFVVVTLIMTKRWMISIERAKDPGHEDSFGFFELFKVYCFSQFIGLSAIGYLGTDGIRIGFTKLYRVKAIPMTKQLVWERGLSLLALGCFPLLFLMGKISFTLFLVATILIFLMRIFLKSTLYDSFLYSLFGHSLKISFLLLVFCFFENLSLVSLGDTISSFERLSQLSLALFVESLPISWQGVGVGQVSFSEIVKGPSGAAVYLIYLESKLLFKILSGLFYLSPRFRENIWNRV